MVLVRLTCSQESGNIPVQYTGRSANSDQIGTESIPDKKYLADVDIFPMFLSVECKVMKVSDRLIRPAFSQSASGPPNGKLHCS